MTSPKAVNCGQERVDEVLGGAGTADLECLGDPRLELVTDAGDHSEQFGAETGVLRRVEHLRPVDVDRVLLEERPQSVNPSRRFSLTDWKSIGYITEVKGILEGTTDVGEVVGVDLADRVPEVGHRLGQIRLWWPSRASSLRLFGAFSSSASSANASLYCS